jgi:type II secretory pathway pseudopilin PulG
VKNASVNLMRRRNTGLRPVVCALDTTAQNQRHLHHRVTLSHQHGFLLIEAMIASVILSVAAMGIVSLLLSAAEQQTALRENSTAVLLAKQLMEEITSKPFGLATPIVPRASMTTANQYNAYQDTTTAMSTLSGEAISPGDGEVFSRKVTITNAPTPTGSSAPASDLQLVTVTVTTPSGRSVSLSQWLTNVTWNQS